MEVMRLRRRLQLIDCLIVLINSFHYRIFKRLMGLGFRNTSLVALLTYLLTSILVSYLN